MLSRLFLLAPVLTLALMGVAPAWGASSVSGQYDNYSVAIDMPDPSFATSRNRYISPEPRFSPHVPQADRLDMFDTQVDHVPTLPRVLSNAPEAPKLQYVSPLDIVSEPSEIHPDVEIRPTVPQAPRLRRVSTPRTFKPHVPAAPKVMTFVP